MRFERGKNPKEYLKIGKYREINAGTYFHIRFRDKRKHPNYLAVQKREQEGIPADALAKDDERRNLDGKRIVHCIVNTIPHEEFTAWWSEKEKCWIVSRVEYRKTDDTGPK